MLYNITQKPTLILMAGLPGSGKTTLAAKLEQALGWELISKDYFKADFMYSGLSDEDAAWNAYEKSFERVAIALQKERRSVILDTSSRPFFIWKRAVELASFSDIDLKALYCVVGNNDELRKQRLFQRKSLISQLNEKTFTMEPDPAHFSHLEPIMHIIHTNMPLEVCLRTAIKCCTVQPQRIFPLDISSVIPPLQLKEVA